MTLYMLAERFVGEVLERPGAASNPFIEWCHESAGLPPGTPDEVPWCSSFVNRLAWLLRLPRSKSARARSWLNVGRPIDLLEAVAGNDVVIFNRGGSTDPTVIDSPGHVAIFGKLEPGLGLLPEQVSVLGGNQGNGVTIARFPVSDVLGVRRLLTPPSPKVG